MTLTTSLYLREPVDPEKLWGAVTELLGQYVEWTPRWEHHHAWEDDNYLKQNYYTTVLGQGLPALTSLIYANDAPLYIFSDEDVAEFDEGFKVPPCNAHLLNLSFDTAYSYRGDNGANCGDLHAFLVHKTGLWLAEQEITDVWWDQENYGTYHRLAEIELLGDIAKGSF